MDRDKGLNKNKGKGQRVKISFKKRSSKSIRKMKERLQKELDTLVPPISLKKENDINERVNAWADKGAEENLCEGPREIIPSQREEKMKKQQTTTFKTKPDAWGIVIGETD